MSDVAKLYPLERGKCRQRKALVTNPGPRSAKHEPIAEIHIRFGGVKRERGRKGKAMEGS